MFRCLMILIGYLGFSSLCHAQQFERPEAARLETRQLEGLVERGDVILLATIDGGEVQSDNKTAGQEEQTEPQLNVMDIFRGRDRLLDKDKNLPANPLKNLVPIESDWAEHLILVVLKYPKDGKPTLLKATPIHREDLGKLQKLLRTK